MPAHNASFIRDGRCLVFAAFSESLRDCHGCRTIRWCAFYDRAGIRDAERLALTRWEDDGGAPASIGDTLKRISSSGH